MKDQTKKIKKDFLERLDNCSSYDGSQIIKNDYLGRKGKLSELYSKLQSLPRSEKAYAGKQINDIKIFLSQKIESFTSSFTEKKSDLDKKDFTLPGDPHPLGSIHPITLVSEQIKDIFSKLGFSLAYGPEVDTEFFNFDALNIKDDHPARDMQDTFYIEPGVVLRTHTSNTQIHTMLKKDPPIKIIAPGRVYRNEDISVRSYCLFHQIEGLYIDKNVTFGDLKGLLNYFAKEFFGENVKTRFRPSFFPFTEPSAEMDIYWGLETESDYRITKGTGWLEILGCGMVDPEVFKSVKIDSEKWTGYAFGMGIERMAMLKYGIHDIRLFYEGDIRVLRQFR
ncbi:MAG: phenylalanine--tRNA ligase subunit alpha [Candidatus Marinimicrobia bacterium]|nr:phenylalanine--tRNA ligase subunit alpha [Candidatus Neomarinimicrobiota bacterium]